MRLAKGDGGPAHLARVIGIAKQEIIRDVLHGYVPFDVPDFAALHDHRDANCYGDLDNECEVAERDGQWPESEDLKCTAFWNDLQDALDAWIKDGGLRRESEHGLTFDALCTLVHFNPAALNWQGAGRTLRVEIKLPNGDTFKAVPETKVVSWRCEQLHTDGSREKERTVRTE